MPKLKHSFTEKAKHSLLFSNKYRKYTKAMLKHDDQDELSYADGAAIRIQEALRKIPRGGRKPLLDRCIDRNGKKGITPQAITGWIKNGRVSHYNLAVLSDITGFRLEYLIHNQLPKLKTDRIDNAISGTYDKNVMALTNTVELPIESLSSRAGGFKPDRTFPTLGPDQARERRELAHSQSDSIKEMISDIEVTSHAYKYIARGIGMMPELNDGDTVLVEPGIEPDDSDMVLVEINGDQCVMQHWRVAGEAWLTFSNPAFAELKQPFSSALFLGVVLAKLHAPTRLSRR